jgi:hypothetical protein
MKGPALPNLFTQPAATRHKKVILVPNSEQTVGARTLLSTAVDLTTLKERRHPESGALCRAKDLSVLRGAPPRRK